MTFSGEDLNVVPIIMVIDIIGNIENMNTSAASMLVERYSIVSTSIRKPKLVFVH